MGSRNPRKIGMGVPYILGYRGAGVPENGDADFYVTPVRRIGGLIGETEQTTPHSLAFGDKWLKSSSKSSSCSQLRFAPWMWTIRTPTVSSVARYSHVSRVRHFMCMRIPSKLMGFPFSDL